jgi:hypothetical protein
MSNNDWNIIFKLKEFCGYLSKNDSIKLSMSSKKLRKLLTKNIFKTLDLNSFICNRSYSSLFIKEEIEQYGSKFKTFINPYKPLTRELFNSKNEFIEELKPFKGISKNLVANGFGRYHYLLNGAPAIFHNITELVLNDSEFTMETLRHLLNNFKSLKSLELTNNLIFYGDEISNNISINYPISLRNLKLGNNSVMVVQDKTNPIDINKHIGDPGRYEFNKTYQHLPNLTTFDYDMDCYQHDENGDLFGFIRLNPQLKCIKLSGYTFNFELFDIIKDYKSLTQIEFKCLAYSSDIENYEMPILRNIKRLHVKNSAGIINAIVTNNFPNLTALVVEYNWSISNEKNGLIKNFPNLKILKFILNNKSKIKNKLTLPELNKLEELEINLNYEEGCLEHVQWDVSAYDKLKLVNYTKNPNCTPFKKPELTEELAKQWGLYYFPHKLAYHKKS